MTEPMPHLTPEVSNFSWEIAQAANRAFDTLREAEANITEVQKVALTVEGVELTYGAIAPLEKIRNDAQTNFRLLTEMATPVMSLPKSPFALNSFDASAIVVPKSVAAITEPSATLPADYRECLVTRYVQKGEAVVRQIKDGTLPENYALPELHDLLERAISLASTYEIMVKNGWQPDVVFVPRGLSLGQWNALLTGHRLADHSWTEGVHRTWAGFEAVPPIISLDANPWGIAVVSAATRPILASVSKDGEHGFNAANAVRALVELPSVGDASSPAAIVRGASPTEERYFALQLSRLERGEMPVDLETWTIGHEDLEIGGELGSLYFYFRPKEHRFKSIWRNREAFDNNDGVRPSAGDEDLIPNA